MKFYRNKNIFFVIVVGLGLYFIFFSKNHFVHSIVSFNDFSMQSIECSGTLVLFDVDETLITLTDRLDFSWPFRLQLLWHFPQFINKQAWEFVYSHLWQQAEFLLVEPIVAQFIQQLRSCGCIVLGLTSMESGSYGVIPNMPEWRYQTLAHFGIVFTQMFGDSIFINFSSYRNNYPVLYKGILCANQQPKGKVLKAFLQQYNIQPKKIIFFDDQIEALQSVGDVCVQLHIPYALYKYKGVKNIQNRGNEDRIFNKIKTIMYRENA